MTEEMTENVEQVRDKIRAEAHEDLEAIIWAIRDSVIPGSPISKQAEMLACLDQVLIPAIIAALKKG